MRTIKEKNIIRKNVPVIRFDKNLQRLRKKNHMSQEMLARKLHLKRQTISSYETGRSIPDIYMMIKLADIFCVTLDELVGRKNE